MSGRLIILPKKTYTPWNPQNLERVMRDERLHKERVEREEEERQKRENIERIRMMKERMSLRNSDGEKGGNNINLNGDSLSVGSNLASLDGRMLENKSDERMKIDESKHVNLFETEEKQKS